MSRLTILLLTTLLLITGCTTSYTTYDYEYSIEDIQKAIADNLPGGLGKVNSDRRVFYSQKFTVDKTKKKNNLVMRIVINGERRPYGLDIETRTVDVTIKDAEEAFNFGDDFRGHLSLAKRVVSQIESQLVQRRKNKNIFDDFKAF